MPSFVSTPHAPEAEELPAGVLHQSHFATVFLDPLADGRFGPHLLRAQDHLQRPIACRVVRRWQPLHRTTIDSVLHQLSSARCVVPLAQYCLDAASGDLLVLDTATGNVTSRTRTPHAWWGAGVRTILLEE